MTGILTATRCSHAVAASPPKPPCNLARREKALRLAAAPLGRRHWGLGSAGSAMLGAAGATLRVSWQI